MNSIAVVLTQNICKSPSSLSSSLLLLRNHHHCRDCHHHHNYHHDPHQQQRMLWLYWVRVGGNDSAAATNYRGLEGWRGKHISVIIIFTFLAMITPNIWMIQKVSLLQRSQPVTAWTTFCSFEPKAPSIYSTGWKSQDSLHWHQIQHVGILASMLASLKLLLTIRTDDCWPAWRQGWLCFSFIWQCQVTWLGRVAKWYGGCIRVKKLGSRGKKFGRVKKWQNHVLSGRFVLQSSMV